MNRRQAETTKTRLVREEKNIAQNYRKVNTIIGTTLYPKKRVQPATTATQKKLLKKTAAQQVARKSDTQRQIKVARAYGTTTKLSMKTFKKACYELTGLSTTKDLKTYCKDNKIQVTALNCFSSWVRLHLQLLVHFNATHHFDLNF